MKKLLVLLTVAILIIMISYQEQAIAKSTVVVKSTVDVLNIRAKPSTDAKVIGKLKKGQTLAYKYKNQNFYAITYKGQTAFVAVAYSKKIKKNDETLQVKSTVDILNIRLKPSAKGKIVGKLKKGQMVTLISHVYNGREYYEVLYKGKKAYIASEYSKIVKPTNNWLGTYFNSLYSGSGASYELTVYKKKGDNIYFLSRSAERLTIYGGGNAKWRENNFYGKAKVISSDKAYFSKKGCKATFSLNKNKIRIYEKSSYGKCEYTGFGNAGPSYNYEVPIYQK